MYKAIITHDIDFVTKYKTIRNVLGAVKRSEDNLFSAFNQYRKNKIDRSTDPYWSMEKMHDINISSGIETRFYFKTAITNSKFDHNDYEINDPDIINLIGRLKSKGAIIGIHPSYETYLDKIQIRKEIEMLEFVTEDKVIHSRQHFLRYKNPDTFNYLSECGIKVDSSIGPRKEIEIIKSSNEYSLFPDLDNSIREQEFIMMDTHLINNPVRLISKLKAVVDQIKYKSGTACILWHNNNFDTETKRNTYREVVKILQA